MICCGSCNCEAGKGARWECRDTVGSSSGGSRWPPSGPVSAWHACLPPDLPPATCQPSPRLCLPWSWFICRMEPLPLSKETKASHILRLLPFLERPPLSSSNFPHPNITAALVLPILQLGKATPFLPSRLPSKSRLNHHQLCGFSLHFSKPPLLTHLCA